MAICAGMFTACVSEDDTELPRLVTPFFSEEFTDVQHNTVLDLADWTNHAASGSVLWKERVFNYNGYAEFNPYQSGDASNIGWLVSPKVDLSDITDVKLVFSSAQNFVNNAANKLEVYISTDFDGSVENATWTQLDANVANPSTTRYEFVSSGIINLSAFEGQQVNIAFKAIGSGTNSQMTGLFQVDNVKLFSQR